VELIHLIIIIIIIIIIFFAVSAERSIYMLETLHESYMGL